MSESSRKQLPRKWSQPPGQRVMVIAPHMDDEVIGCGGILAKYRNLKVPCGVTFVMTETRRPSVRWNEAEKAHQVLGTARLFRLNGNDSQVDDETSVHRLFEIFQETQFDTLFLPTLDDWHPEHQYSIGLVNRLFTDYAVDVPNVYGYEVWSHPFPQILIDVSKEFPIKREAMDCYQSQLALFNYRQMIDGMATMRASFFRRNVTHAEAFQDYGDAAMFRSEFEKMKRKETISVSETASNATESSGQ